MTTHAESINSDLQRGLDRHLRHTQHRTQNRTSPLKYQRTTNTTATSGSVLIIEFLQIQIPTDRNSGTRTRATQMLTNTIVEKWSTPLTDLCKVNLGLANEVKKLIGTEWLPGQGFCNLHYTLAIPVGIKEVLALYQSYIGADKLFPHNVSFEMEIEDKLISIQILDYWMRLTSIRWQARPWNRYVSFIEYADKRGFRNVGHMLHANRFNEFEERCGGGVCLADVWISWLDTFSDVRNQLACFLRTTNNLMNMCKFLWAGVAFIGIHVTSPYMSMLVDHKTTPRELLNILPNLYHDLMQYPKSMIDFKECAIPSLKKFFLNPLERETSPYGSNVCLKVKEFTDKCNQELMDLYLKQICTKLAEILKRQRGDQYGFGDNPESEMLVTKNMSESMLDDPDASHTKSIENYFGNMDRGIKKSGPQGFNKVSNDLVIKYSKDLIGENFEWHKKANREASKRLSRKQVNFDANQRQLMKLGVDEDDAERLSTGNKILKCLSSCKSHGGPVTSVTEFEALVEKMTDKKKLHTALNLEIRFRKFTFTTVKETCPLFKPKKLTIPQKVTNIRSLITSQLDLKTLADLNDLEDAIKATATECVTNAPFGEIPIDADKKSDETANECVTNAPFGELPMDVEEKSDEISMKGDRHEYVLHEFVIGAFEDGYYPGEIKGIYDETLSIVFFAKDFVQR